MNKIAAISSILLFSLLLGAMHLSAQEQPSLRKRADDLYLRMAYAEALPLYEKLVQGKKTRISDIERIAASYQYLNEYQLAENWYARAVHTEGHSKESLTGYAQALKNNGKYVEAKAQLQRYASVYGSSDAIQLEIAGCDSAVRWMAEPQPYKLRNEKEVNTDLAEFGAVPTSNGVLYTGEPKVAAEGRSGMTGQAYLKIFSADRSEEFLNFTNLMPASFNEAAYHVGPIVANKDENTLYVTRTYPGSQTERFKEEGFRLRKHNLELKIYKLQGSAWVEYDFPYNNVEAYSLGHAALSDDEQTLYFASNMPGGHGGVDIWYCELQADGSWAAPVNAGSPINSAGDEMFPTIFGDRLYYSSNGYAGMGGLDIYTAKGARNNFVGRRNLQYPINSAGDDFSYVVMADDEDAYYGYISSNRPGGVGSDDIYSFDFAKPVFRILLMGKVYDKKTGELLGDSRASLYSGSTVSARKTTDASGNFAFELDKGLAYHVSAEHEGYMSDSAQVAAVFPTRDTTINIALYLEPMMKVGDKIVLENLYYDFDKHNIRPDAALVLDHLVAVMRDNPTLKIELSSHTDSRGSDSYNLKLSQRRAESAVDYVVSRGIARERIIAKGYGETRLVNRCSNGVRCTIAEHQANRRTEVEVVEL